MRSFTRFTLPAALLTVVTVAGCGGIDERPADDPSEVDGPDATGGGAVHGESYSEDPTEVAKIDLIESGFDAKFGDSYSFIIEYREGRKRSTECDLREARIVVESGAVTDAVALPTRARDACRIDAADAPTAAGVFDIARSLSGINDFSIDANVDATGISLSATDDDVLTRISIEGVSKSTAPTSIGWSGVHDDAASARELWREQSFDYVLDFRSYAFFDRPRSVVTVVDGEPTRVVEYIDGADEGTDADPAKLAELGVPLSVDDIFGIIDDEDGSGYVAAVFDSDTGVPTALWFDPIPEGVDDEYAVFTSVERL